MQIGVFFWVVLSTIVVGVYSRPIAKLLGVVDTPGGRKKHSKETPLVGGIAFCLAILPFLPFYFDNSLVGYVIAITVLLFLVLGVMDDRKHLSPYFRMVYSTIVIGVAIWLVPELRLETLRPSFIPVTISLGFISIPFTLICLLGLQNAINMADGKNGLVLGLSIIWALAMAVHALVDIAAVLGTSILAMVIVLLFNLKDRLFLGDGGTYSLSIFLGMIAIYLHQTQPAEIPSDLVVLWFLIPALDCARLIFIRVYNGKSPFDADRNHLHHVAMAVFPNKKYRLVMYLVLVGLPIVAATYFPDLTAIITITMVGVYTLLFVTLNRLASKNVALSVE